MGHFSFTQQFYDIISTDFILLYLAPPTVSTKYLLIIAIVFGDAISTQQVFKNKTIVWYKLMSTKAFGKISACAHVPFCLFLQIVPPSYHEQKEKGSWP